ncbi:ATP-dependent DNA helicase RecG [Patescibacteria group bacterium]|nr:ATP-dependent DNA helicase RecG [Patescibacteria group bacterium]
MFFLLSDPLTHLPGIGPSLSSKLSQMGLKTVGDLLTYYPRRWEDLSQITPLNGVEAALGRATVRARLLSFSSFRTPRRRMFLINGLLEDETGALRVVWFNQPYLTQSLKKGAEYYLSGPIRERDGHLVLTNPSIEPAEKTPVHSGRIIPIYPATAGISTRMLRRWLKNLIATIRELPDTLPEDIRKNYRLIDRAHAIENIHFPHSLSAIGEARRRLGFEELLLVHLGLLIAKQQWEKLPTKAIPHSPDLIKDFEAQLGFKLTPTQKTSIKEILSDIAKSIPMNRLLLGDVGSGKTAVAAAALVATAKAGRQSALMAPTEVLATQHYYNLQPLLAKFGVSTTLLTGSTKLHDYSEIENGDVDVVIGTHALIQKQVGFKNLNLVIVDEQHRFGVRQREKLKNKALDITPHYLSLSATPIPRTLFLGLLHNLEISELTSIPTGRLPIITRLVTEQNRATACKLIEREIKDGHAIFVITPLIDEVLNDEQERASIASELKSLKRSFPKARIGSLHGRVASEEKLELMTKIKNGDLDILVATSVIEVGIDVPRATIIWIKNADRFGLAQLHQLRGRVGRSSLQSYCLIETNSAEQQNEEDINRLTSFVKINDGSKLAEIDLKLRGPGAFFGSNQSGLLHLKIANLTDKKLITETRTAAEAMLKTDPTLTHHPELKARLSFNYVTHEE